MEIRIDPENAFFRCVEDSSEAIMISDPAGLLLYVNPAWERIYGYSSEEAVGKTPGLLHSGLQSKDFYNRMWAEIRDPKHGHWKGELVNRCKDGSLVPVLLTITPVRSKSGKIGGYMGIAIDVRSQKELEAKVAHQDRLASVGLLASGIAHEVGTPLGVIRGRAEMIVSQLETVGTESGAATAKIQKSLEVIIGQADRISRLIQSLLGMSRSFGELKLEVIDPKEVIDDVLALVGQNLRNDQVSINLDLEPGAEAIADASRLRQIVLNLLTNSTHAIRKAIRQGRTEGHELTIRLKRHQDRVLLSVADSGCGISEKLLNEIFKPFFTTKDIGEGTGLGLSIVAQLVKEIEATIQVRSTEGVGTTFTVGLRKA